MTDINNIPLKIFQIVSNEIKYTPLLSRECFFTIYLMTCKKSFTQRISQDFIITFINILTGKK
ncbi:MAG: hypothetical protein C4526_05340 [Nitrospiraceae bacterium]|nr:MAG: hypothetical protein C4526_05340 [Nitrospiraceae bacterium]